MTCIAQGRVSAVFLFSLGFSEMFRKLSGNAPECFRKCCGRCSAKNTGKFHEFFRNRIGNNENVSGHILIFFRTFPENFRMCSGNNPTHFGNKSGILPEMIGKFTTKSGFVLETLRNNSRTFPGVFGNISGKIRKISKKFQKF